MQLRPLTLPSQGNSSSYLVGKCIFLIFIILLTMKNCNGAILTFCIFLSLSLTHCFVTGKCPAEFIERCSIPGFGSIDYKTISSLVKTFKKIPFEKICLFTNFSLPLLHIIGCIAIGTEKYYISRFDDLQDRFYKVWKKKQVTG